MTSRMGKGGQRLSLLRRTHRGLVGGNAWCGVTGGRACPAPPHLQRGGVSAPAYHFVPHVLRHLRHTRPAGSLVALARSQIEGRGSRFGFSKRRPGGVDTSRGTRG